MITYYSRVMPLIRAVSVDIGLLFIIAASVRLIIKGVLSAYRKLKS